MRVYEAAIGKRSDIWRAPYALRKNQTRSKAKDDLPFQPKFKMSYKELLAMPSMADHLRFPPKSNRNLGLWKEIWCDFHKAFGHDLEHCITLGYQLTGLVKDGFLKEYLEGNQDQSKEDLQSAVRATRCLSMVRLIQSREDFRDEVAPPLSVRVTQGMS